SVSYICNSSDPGLIKPNVCRRLHVEISKKWPECPSLSADFGEDQGTTAGGEVHGSWFRAWGWTLLRNGGTMMTMGLSNAERQKRWRQKRDAQARANPEVIEQALLQDVERAERGELSEQQRVELANRLADTANRLLWDAQRLARLARKVRTGSDH